ncbi:MAG: hypothetical protein HOP29_01695 [Phycisphaerales bacterium]|nr:hypothetical protein [Phycisphaerales bacterium]
MSQHEQGSCDLLIDEVRQRRRDLFTRMDLDLDRLVEAVRAIEAEHPEKVVDRRAMLDRRTMPTERFGVNIEDV